MVNRLTLETVEKVRAGAHEVCIEPVGLSSVAVAAVLNLLLMLTATTSLIVIVHLNFN